MSNYQKPKFKIITNDGQEKRVKPKFKKLDKNSNNQTCYIPLFKIAMIVLIRRE